MSTFNIDPNTDIKTEFLKPPDTNPNIVLTAPDDKTVTVLGVLMSNNDPAPQVVTLDAHDGVSTYEIADSIEIPGNSVVELEVPVTLKRTWTLRFTAGVPNGACITATYYVTPTAVL